MKTITFNFLFLFSIINTIAQPVSSKKFMTDCEEYQLNFKKVKIKIKPFHAYFKLVNVDVQIDEPPVVYHSFCKNEVKVTSAEGDFKRELEEHILKSYPEVNKPKMKIVVKDLKVLRNLLPTASPRLYISIDYYLANESEDFELKYSTTKYLEIGKYIEKPLGNLIKLSIADFHKYKFYKNNVAPNKSFNNPDGMYTSFSDLKRKQPTYPLYYKVIHEEKTEFRSKHTLINEDDQNVEMPILAFTSMGKDYINAVYYYRRNYFVELSSVDEDYYFIYDKIYNYIKGSRGAGMAGAGFVGAGFVLAGAAAAGAANASSYNRIPGFIDKKTGKLITFKNRHLKEALGPNFATYKSILEIGNREKLLVFFQKIFKETEIKEKLFSDLD